MTSNGLPSVSEVEANVIVSSDSICVALVKMIRCFEQVYRLLKYEMGEDGKISGAYCAEIKTCVATNTATTTP